MNITNEIVENLRDAGCDEKEIAEITTCFENGERKKAEKLIALCRKKQLQRLHDSQRRIDCLDFLSWRLTNEKA